MSAAKKSRLIKRKVTEESDDHFFDFKVLPNIQKNTKRRKRSPTRLNNTDFLDSIQEVQETLSLPQNLKDIITNDDSIALLTYFRDAEKTQHDYKQVYDMLTHAAEMGSFDCFIDILLHDWNIYLQSSSSIDMFKFWVLQDLMRSVKMTTGKGLMWYHDEIEEFSVNEESVTENETSKSVKRNINCKKDVLDLMCTI